MNVRALLPLILTALGSVAYGTHPEWDRFRGPNGSGIGSGPIPTRWTEQTQRWKTPLPGVGHSSPVVWGQRVFVTSGDETNGSRHLLCLEFLTGKVLWSRTFPGEAHRKHADSSYASATPTVDARHVYVAWGGPKDYLVVALDHDGREAWRVDLGPFKAGHGFGPSPILHDDLVILANDQEGESSLVALDRNTGARRWTVPRQSKATYTTPCVYQQPGRKPELIFTNYEHGVTSIDPKTGQVNWELSVFDRGHIETAIGSPVVAGDLVLACAGWLGVRQEVVAVRVPTDRREQPREVYRITRSAPLCTTPLVKDGLLFLWSDAGIVTCADVRTGEVIWRERVPGNYYSSPVCAGRHLINVSRSGDVVVLAADRRFELLARHSLGEGSHSTPAIVGDTLLVRTYSHLLAMGPPR
ncbi:MAG: PQQ-binding-like beta-propeller repeat protein [Gemmataceae bacterium]|nr:PQQ-binding-like beta-propeller repeat protein [Gemmataceae bacterium]MDW8266142.1 PQQ-binding-like beta-propeller repeat protein [Gemmataceae bacterium]